MAKVEAGYLLYRDISQPESPEPLKSLGSISSHTRPVECLDGAATSETSAILFTGDTMGVIKVWNLQKDTGTPPRWNATEKDAINHHRTRINELRYGNGQLWTGTTPSSSRVSDIDLLHSKLPPTKLFAFCNTRLTIHTISPQLLPLQ